MWPFTRLYYRLQPKTKTFFRAVPYLDARSMVSHLYLSSFLPFYRRESLQANHWNGNSKNQRTNFGTKGYFERQSAPLTLVEINTEISLEVSLAKCWSFLQNFFSNDPQSTQSKQMALSRTHLQNTEFSFFNPLKVFHRLFCRYLAQKAKKLTSNTRSHWHLQTSPRKGGAILIGSFWQTDISQFNGFCIYNQEAERRKK